MTAQRLILLLGLLVGSSCGKTPSSRIPDGPDSVSPSPMTHAKTMETNEVRGEWAGVTFRVPNDSRITISEDDYEFERPVILILLKSKSEPQSMVFVSSFKCEKKSKNREEFQNYIYDETKKLLDNGLSHQTIKLFAEPHDAIQAVSRPADSEYRLGFYFDSAMPFNENIIERFIVIGDLLSEEDRCIRVKASSEARQALDLSTLLGRTIAEIQTSIRLHEN